MRPTALERKARCLVNRRPEGQCHHWPDPAPSSSDLHSGSPWMIENHFVQLCELFPQHPVAPQARGSYHLQTQVPCHELPILASKRPGLDPHLQPKIAQRPRSSFSMSCSLS
jgi:hypothetical protein